MEVELRSFLSELKKRGGLLEVEEEVELRYEITAVLKEVLGEQGGPAVLFKNVRGYPGRSVVGNLLASRKLTIKCAFKYSKKISINKRLNKGRKA